MDIRLDVPILQFVDNIQNSEEQKVREIIVDIINVSPQAPRPNWTIESFAPDSPFTPTFDISLLPSTSENNQIFPFFVVQKCTLSRILVLYQVKGEGIFFIEVIVECWKLLFV
jgi:hypothetical protein